jgi:amidophosphoribosyltransferase
MIERRRVGFDVDTERKSFGEKCGIVAIYNPTDNILKQFQDGSIAIRELWHRGQQGLGALVNRDRLIRRLRGFTAKGAPATIFNQELDDKFDIKGSSTWMLFHARYGTSGDNDKSNLQPITVKDRRKNTFSIIHNGEFVAKEEMAKLIPEQLPEKASDTYVFAKLLQYSEGETTDEKIVNALGKAKGAYSLAIGTKDALYAARDKYGVRPMIVAKYGNGFIIVSETCALDKLGITPLRVVERGEIIKFDKDGFTVLREKSNGTAADCGFEFDYFSRPDSMYPPTPEDFDHPEKWRSFSTFRTECGKTLAREKPIKADFVFGAPDSGVAAAIGYAIEMGIPYVQAALRAHYSKDGGVRVFMKDDEGNLKEKARGKLALVRDLFRNARAICVDDSIVRGDTSPAIVEEAFDAGALEVHYLSAFPPVCHSCPLGVSMRTQEELIAYRHKKDEKKIAEEIGATSVGYISLEGFVKTLRGSRFILPNNLGDIALANGLCLGCCTGNYPVDRNGTEYPFTIFERNNQIRKF